MSQRTRFLCLPLLGLLLLLPSPALCTEEQPLTGSFSASALHLGGGIGFSLASESVDGESSATVTFGLDARLSYFLIDGLALSAIPSFRVSSSEEVTSLVVGAGVGMSYYLDLGALAPFARAQAGLLFGRQSKDDQQNSLKGFAYGGGLGIAIPLFSNLLELGVDYEGTSLSLERPDRSVDVQRHALLAGLGMRMVFY